MAAEVTGLDKALADLEKTRAAFTDLEQRVMPLLDKQNEEIKSFGSSTTETSKKLQEQGKLYDQLGADISGVKQALDKLQKEQARSRLIGPSGIEFKSLGQILVESEQFKAMRSAGERRMPGVVVPEMEYKSEIMTSTELGALNVPYRAQPIQDPLRPRRLRDLMIAIAVTASSVEYPREDVTLILQANITVAAVIGENHVHVDKVAGFYVGQTVKVHPQKVGEEELIIASIDADALTLTFTTNLTGNHAKGRNVSADHFIFTPEANIKPSSHIEFSLIPEPIKNLSTIMAVSQEMLEDTVGLRQLVDSRLREFTDLSEEQQILNGDGSTNQLSGILNNTDISSYLWGNGYVGDTKLDAIRRAITFVSLSFLPADISVVHPTDWEEIETTKGDDGHYIFNQAPSNPAGSRVWKTEVVESAVIPVLTALVGSFRMGAVIWDRKTNTVSISDSNKDGFEKGIIYIKNDKRLGLSVVRPKAFCKVTFNAAPQA